MRPKILLPTDFSNNSIKAIKYATELYSNDACNFYVLHVFHMRSNVMGSLMVMQPGNAVYEKTNQESEQRLSRIIDMMTYNGNAKHKFIPISVFNLTIEAIRGVVDRHGIDVIIMGSRGTSRDTSNGFGSTAIRVMEKIRNCPVIMVPESSKIKLPNEIVFPTDYKHPFQLRELLFLVDTANRAKAKIAILHVSNEEQLSDDQLKNKLMLNEYLEDVSFTHFQLSEYEVDVVVNIFAESRESGMISFINRKHPFFGTLHNHSLTKRLGKRSKFPLLVLHELNS